VNNPHGRLTEALAERYSILREVGVGGMATVFLAEDLKHGRKVALKVLKPELAAVLGADRFPREIRTVAQFNHPHILSLYDSGETDGFLYYVMPFVEGESLRDRLDRDGKLPVSDVVRIMHEVADALAYSHARGVVHRDIKPGNVLLSGRHAVVTDFGVAKALSASGTDKSTTVGMAVGTPQYMAPEQAMGEENVDHRADIYALGLLAYEMLAGRHVFTAATAQGLLAAHVMEVPEDIRQLRPDTPASLAEAVMRCLAKSRDDRWQSADELITRLEAIPVSASGGMTPTETRPHTKAYAGTSSAPRATGSRRAMMLVVAAVLVLAAGAGAYAVFGKGAPARIEMIGVMPIEDISGKDSTFVAAMHADLTSALIKTNVIGVAGRSVMMRYKGGSKSLREIAQEQKLGAVVEATVFRAGDIMRINVQFTDPVTSKSLWTDTYDQNVSNVLNAQKDVVDKIATGIRTALATPRKNGGGS
jgi:eukaryotic-like serine/threonine-protein kinase